MKKYIKWLIYYAVIIAAIMLVVLLSPQALDVNIFSLFPLILMGVWIGTLLPNKYERRGGQNAKRSPYEIKTVLLVAPIYLPFIFFFSYAAKLFIPLLMFLIGAVWLYLHSTRELNKMLDEHNAELAEELEEQKKKEELGRWK